MIRRHLAPAIAAALADTPVVLLHGARQVGKTTLVRQLAESGAPGSGRRYVTLDDASSLGAAKNDPVGFLRGLGGAIVVDEVQRAPEIFPAIKLLVDQQRAPGRFLLTGSANVMMLPKLSESLAGRIEILTLSPLSQGEIAGRVETFIDDLFGSGLGTGVRADGTEARHERADPVAALIRGGYPDALARTSEERRVAWFGSYVTSVLQRDVRDIAAIEDLTALPRLLTLAAARVGGLVNYSDFSRGLGIPTTTLKRYFALLRATFLLVQVPAWSSNLGLRLTKSPKLYLADTGLLAYLLGMNTERASEERTLLGPMLENFVGAELLKQIGWSTTKPSMFHFRTAGGQEVDFILEDRAGRIVGVEVKASGSVNGDHFRGLRALADVVGKRFVRGVVLYTGTETVPFGSNMTAAPVARMWE